MWASAPTGARGRAGDPKGRPYVLGPSGVPVGAAFMAARSVRSPRVSVREPRGSGRMWASAPTGVRGGADVHKGRPHAFGPPSVPVGAAFMAARSVRSPGCRCGNPAAAGGCGHPPLRTCARQGGRPQGSPLRVGAARCSCRGGLYGRPTASPARPEAPGPVWTARHFYSACP